MVLAIEATDVGDGKEGNVFVAGDIVIPLVLIFVFPVGVFVPFVFMLLLVAAVPVDRLFNDEDGMTCFLLLLFLRVASITCC